MTDQPDTLRQRIADAVRHGLAHAEADPDSVEPETVRAVLALVQPIADDRDRFAAGVPLVCCDERHAAKVRGLAADRDQLAYRCESKTDAIRALNADCESLDRERQQAAAELEREQRVSAERGRYLAEVDAALIAAGQDEGGGYIAYARRISQLAAERDRLAAAIQRVRALHQHTEGLGYDCDEDDTPGSYGRIAQACTACGTPQEHGVRWPCPTSRALDGPAAPAQPTPCSEPDPCEDGELCGAHEEEQAHADGDHEHCDITCEAAMPSDQMRNFILAKGYPGTAGALDELLRRAAAGTSRPAAPADEHRYRDAVNAPLRPETVAALRTRLETGDHPRRRVSVPDATVQGRCPACGGQSLYLGDGGYVTCRKLACPQPDAASTFLERPTEVRAATLAQADAAITAAIDRDRALFPARSSDRAALGAAREIIRHLAATADRPAAQVGSACCGSPIGHYPGCRINLAPAVPAADLRGGFWPGMTGGLCSRCHIAEVRGGQRDPDCADCRQLAADRPAQCGPACTEQHTYDGCCQQGPAAGQECPLSPAVCEQRRCTQPAARPADDTHQQDDKCRRCGHDRDCHFKDGRCFGTDLPWCTCTSWYPPR